MQRFSRAPWAALILGALSFGCGEVPGTDGGRDAEWPEGTFQVGVPVDGGEVFGAFPPEVDLSPGAQGGYHVDVQYRVEGAPAEQVLFTHRVRLTDGGTLVSRGTRVFEVGPSPGGWVSPPFPVFMCPTPIGVSVLNATVTFEVEATRNDGGLLGTAHGTSVLRCAPGGYCESICKG